jgi:hypothetical protein
MQRLYVSTIVAAGLGQRPKVANYIQVGVSVNSVIRGNVQIGDWALSVVDIAPMAAVSHAVIAADPDCHALPDFAYDSKLSSMHLPTRRTMRDRLAARGIDMTFLDNVDGYREVVRTLGQLCDPGFNEDNFDARAT